MQWLTGSEEKKWEKRKEKSQCGKKKNVAPKHVAIDKFVNVSVFGSPAIWTDVSNDMQNIKLNWTRVI